jgi:hypothetical protein
MHEGMSGIKNVLIVKDYIVSDFTWPSGKQYREQIGT